MLEDKGGESRLSCRCWWKKATSSSFLGWLCDMGFQDPECPCVGDDSRSGQHGPVWVEMRGEGTGRTWKLCSLRH